jgi:hypothetical protein
MVSCEIKERSESTSRWHLGLVDIDASKGGTVARYQPNPIPVEGCKPGCDSLFRVTREAHDTRGSVRGGRSKGDVVHAARLGVDAPPLHPLGKHLTSDRGRWGSSSHQIWRMGCSLCRELQARARAWLVGPRLAAQERRHGWMECRAKRTPAISNHVVMKKEQKSSMQ